MFSFGLVYMPVSLHVVKSMFWFNKQHRTWHSHWIYTEQQKLILNKNEWRQLELCREIWPSPPRDWGLGPESGWHLRWGQIVQRPTQSQWWRSLGSSSAHGGFWYSAHSYSAMHRSNYTEQNVKQRHTDAAYTVIIILLYLYSAYQGWKKVHTGKKAWTEVNYSN